MLLVYEHAILLVYEHAILLVTDLFVSRVKPRQLACLLYTHGVSHAGSLIAVLRLRGPPGLARPRKLRSE